MSFLSYLRRLETFRNSPPEIACKRKLFAMAGFLYTGKRDVVYCAHCQCVLENWHPADKPLDEHAKFSPACKFVLQQKGFPAPASTTNQTSPVGDETIASTALRVQTKQTNSEYTNASDQKNQEPLSRQSPTAVRPSLPSLAQADETETDQQTQKVEQQIDCNVNKATNEKKIEEVSRQFGFALEIFRAELITLNRQLDQLNCERVCVICMERERNTLLLPCAHLICCQACSALFDTCPLCRSKAELKIRTYN